MPKKIYSKELYAFQFTDEDRTKVAEFIQSLTGLVNVSKVEMLPHGMYIETLETKKEDAANA